MAQETREFLDVGEVASLLNVSKAAIYRWVEDGRFRARKAGTLLRFTREDVDDFLERKPP